MKKLIGSALLGMTLVSGVMFAKAQENMLENVISTNHVASIKSSDVEFLFKDVKANSVVLLSDEEMQETKGQFWGLILKSYELILDTSKFIYNIGQNQGWWK